MQAELVNGKGVTVTNFMACVFVVFLAVLGLLLCCGVQPPEHMGSGVVAHGLIAPQHVES